MRVRIVMASCVLLALMTSQGFRTLAQSAPRNRITVSQAWTTGIISDGAGPAGIIVTNLTADGIADTVTCSSGSAFVLNKVATGSDYNTPWYSPNIGCSRVAVGDRNGDSVEEVYVGTTDGKVYIYLGDTFAQVGMITLPVTGQQGPTVNDLGVANVDGNSNQQIVVVTSDNTFVYDANTLTMEWQASGKGGSRLGIGQIDDDPGLEIVVNGNPAHVLDAVHHTEKWAYSGGFGIDLGVGDVDGDGKAEIAFVTGGGYQNSDLYVFDADTLTIKWHVGPLFGMQVIAVGDTDGDHVDEVITGDGQWGSVRGWRGIDGGSLWAIANPYHGVFGIGVGDANNDGVNEVLWGAGLSDSGKDSLLMGNWQTQSIVYDSDDLDGALYVAGGDIDNDGQSEVVLASRSTNSGYAGGTVRVYDAATQHQKWSAIISSSFYDISQVAVGQLDADPAKEIVVGGDNWYNTRLQVYDGVTHQMEWQSAVLGNGAPVAMVVKNLDSDPVDEIVVALAPNRVQVFNGASNLIEWDSGPLDGSVLDVAAGDFDGNSVQDLAILTDQGVYVYEGGTWAQEWHTSVSGGTHIAIADGHESNPGQLLVSTAGQDSTALLQSWSGGGNHNLLWQDPQGAVTILHLYAGDLLQNGTQDVVIAGYMGTGYAGNNRSLLRIGILGNPPSWEYEDTNYWGAINGVASIGSDGNGHSQLAFGSTNLIQLDNLTGPLPPSTPTPTATPIPPSSTPTPTATPIPPSSTPTATSTATPIPCGIGFSDVQTTDYFYDAVRYLYCHWIISGYADGTFRPYNNTTRGQLSKIVVLAMGWQMDTTGGPHFQDVPQNSDFYPYIETAYNRGVISGYGCGTNCLEFRPGANITRAQLCKIIVNSRGWTINTVGGPHFSDVPSSDPFYGFIETAYYHGVISGYSCGYNCLQFRPNNYAIRGQISKIVFNALSAPLRR